MGLATATSRETLVGVFDVWLNLAALVSPGHLPSFAFLGNPEEYTRRTPVPPRSTAPPAADVFPLGRAAKHENIFWAAYSRIGVNLFDAWERQDPYRLRVPDRIRIVEPFPAADLVFDVPEVFLFPSGWSTTFWFRIKGPLVLEQLPDLLWSLSSEPRLRLDPDGHQPLSLDSVMTAFAGRTSARLYGRDVKPKRLASLRVVGVIDSEDAGPAAGDYEWLTLDKHVAYGSLESHRFNPGELPAMERSSQRVEHFGGIVLVRFGRGLFIDLPNDVARPQNRPKRRRCFEHNLRNMAMMGVVLQATVTFGARLLPAATAFAAMPAPEQQRYRALHRLVAGGQEILRAVPEEYKARVCRQYWAYNDEIQKALSTDVPDSYPG